MKTIKLLVVMTSLVAACDEGPSGPEPEGSASGKADDAALLCAEHTPSPLDGRSIEDMQRTSKDPRVLATAAHVAELENAAKAGDTAAKLSLAQIETTAQHFGREHARDLVDTSDSGVSAGQMTYGDVEFDIVLFFEDEQSHGLAFLGGTLDPIGEIGINYDIVGCKRG